MTRHLFSTYTAVLLLAGSASAQQKATITGVPEILFTSVPNFLKLTTAANPVMYVSNSNPPNDLDTAGEIYKMRLDGSMIGRFGRAGKLLKEFGTVNAIDCRGENTLYVGEVGNFRVQKLTIH